MHTILTTMRPEITIGCFMPLSTRKGKNWFSGHLTWWLVPITTQCKSTFYYLNPLQNTQTKWEHGKTELWKGRMDCLSGSSIIRNSKTVIILCQYCYNSKSGVMRQLLCQAVAVYPRSISKMTTLKGSRLTDLKEPEQKKTKKTRQITFYLLINVILDHRPNHKQRKWLFELLHIRKLACSENKMGEYQKAVGTLLKMDTLLLI